MTFVVAVLSRKLNNQYSSSYKRSTYLFTLFDENVLLFGTDSVTLLGSTIGLHHSVRVQFCLHRVDVSNQTTLPHWHSMDFFGSIL